MAEKTGLEEIAERVARQGKDLPRSELERLILQELLFERRTQETVTRQQLDQVAPDLAGLRQHVGELMSKFKRMAAVVTKLQGLVVRQRAANNEDRVDAYRLIKAMKKIAAIPPTGDGALMNAQNIADEALAVIRPSIIKQMRTWKET